MSVIDDIKSVGNVLQKAGNIEVYSKIINIQTEIMNLQEQNNELKKELGQLKALGDIEQNLMFESNMYFMYRGHNKDGPFCTCCWDGNKKLIRLHSKDVDFKCPVCGTFIDTGSDDNGVVFNFNNW